MRSTTLGPTSRDHNEPDPHGARVPRRGAARAARHLRRGSRAARRGARRSGRTPAGLRCPRVARGPPRVPHGGRGVARERWRCARGVAARLYPRRTRRSSRSRAARRASWGLLRELPYALVESPPNLPDSDPQTEALLVASRDEPRLLDPARVVFDPVVPMPTRVPSAYAPWKSRSEIRRQKPSATAALAPTAIADALLAKAMGELTAFDAKAKPADDEAPSPKPALPRRSDDAFDRNRFGRSTAEGRVLFEHARGTPRGPRRDGRDAAIHAGRPVARAADGGSVARANRRARCVRRRAVHQRASPARRPTGP